jgi:hypothetical protein
MQNIHFHFKIVDLIRDIVLQYSCSLLTAFSSVNLPTPAPLNRILMNPPLATEPAELGTRVGQFGQPWGNMVCGEGIQGFLKEDSQSCSNS